MNNTCTRFVSLDIQFKRNFFCWCCLLHVEKKEKRWIRRPRFGIVRCLVSPSLFLPISLFFLWQLRRILAFFSFLSLPPLIIHTIMFSQNALMNEYVLLAGFLHALTFYFFFLYSILSPLLKDSTFSVVIIVARVPLELSLFYNRITTEDNDCFF